MFLQPLFVLLLSVPAIAGGQGELSLEKARASFASEQAYQFQTLKKIKSVIREKSFEGVFTTQKGKIRWVTEKPRKVDQLYDGKNFYSIQYPIQKNEKAVVVKASLLNKQNSILTIFRPQKPLKKLFKVAQIERNGSLETFRLKPLVSDLNVEELKVTVDSEKEMIRSISYSEADGLNETTIEFRKKKKLSELPKQFFKFQLPEGARVVEQ